MATSNICRGEQCPVKQQCLRHRQWVKTVQGGETRPKCIAKCPDGKWFERDERTTQRVRRVRIPNPQRKAERP